VDKAIYDVHYADQRSALVMEADLDRGWTKLQKTYGFFRQIRVPYRNDLTIRAQMTVIAQPASFEDWASIFPDAELDRTDESSFVCLKQRKLALKVPLTPDRPWRKTEQGRPEIFVEWLPLLRFDNVRWFDLRAWIVFHEGAPRPIPDVRIWAENHLVVPAGQFESNRRRH
jgi:hypothetical protein